MRAGRYNRPMSSRVVALLLAFVLLWSGLGSIEVPRAAAQAPAIVGLADGGSPAAAEGTVEQHHLDDLPSQALIDPPAETPGLLSSPLAPSAHALVMAQPRTLASAELRPPFLAGPLRPPCGTFAG
jgi:hypothetical protein